MDLYLFIYFSPFLMCLRGLKSAARLCVLQHCNQALYNKSVSFYYSCFAQKAWATEEDGNIKIMNYSCLT